MLGRRADEDEEDDVVVVAATATPQFLQQLQARRMLTAVESILLYHAKRQCGCIHSSV